MKKISAIFIKMNQGLQRVEMLLGVLCLFTLFTVMISNAVARYVLKTPILWADELNNFLFVWFSFLASAYMMGNDGHIRVNDLINLLPLRLRFYITFLMNAIMLVMFVIFVGPTYKLLGTVTFSGLMRIPLKYIYFILPLSFGLMGFHILNNMLQETNRYLSERGAIARAASGKGGK